MDISILTPKGNYLSAARDVFSMVAFDIGGKAMQQIMELDADGQIKTDLKNAKAYAEGREVFIFL